MLNVVRWLSSRRLTCAVIGVTLLFADAAVGQDRAAPVTGEAFFNVFVNGTPVGVERVTLVRTEGGWQIVSSGRFSPPIDLDNRAFRIDYDDEWAPQQMTMDGARYGQAFTVSTTFDGGVATSLIQTGIDRSTAATPVDPAAIVVPDYFFGAFEAMVARLGGAEPGQELPIFIAPQAQITAVVREVRSQQVQTAERLLTAQIYRLTFLDAERPLDVDVWADQDRRLLRLTIPILGVEVAREDVVRVSTRLTTERHPGATDVRVPATGFSLASTVTTPVGREMPQDGWPAVLLVPGTASVDRDENLFGVPLFAQLAAALADEGYLVMRYDKRGAGQSGGRQESAALEDYADDVRTLVRYLDRRDDVDEKRIAVAGHGEGGWVGLYAASREKRIDALALLHVPSIRGTEFVLEQQRAELDRIQAPAAERVQKIELQRQIHAAVLDEGDWEDIPDNLRLGADTFWFRSFLEFDPAEVMRRTRQPVLILHGELDRQIPPHHADRLAELALSRRREESTIQLAKMPGINHLLLRATTGGVAEYSRLSDKNVASEVISVLTDWLARTVPPDQ